MRRGTRVEDVTVVWCSRVAQDDTQSLKKRDDVASRKWTDAFD